MIGLNTSAKWTPCDNFLWLCLQEEDDEDKTEDDAEDEEDEEQTVSAEEVKIMNNVYQHNSCAW